MTRLSHHEWYVQMVKCSQRLQAEPDDLAIARELWALMGKVTGFDVRTGKRAIATFGRFALKSDEGLGELITALRRLASELGEYPRPDLFAPPLENLLRQTARDSDHPFSADAAWILSHCDEDF